MFLAKTKKNFLFQLVAVFTLIIVLLTEDVTGNILIFMTTQFFMIFSTYATFIKCFIKNIIFFINIIIIISVKDKMKFLLKYDLKRRLTCKERKNKKIN